MKRSFVAIFSFVVAFMFLLPPTAIAESWSKGSTSPSGGVVDEGGSIAPLQLENEEVGAPSDAVNKKLEAIEKEAEAEEWTSILAPPPDDMVLPPERPLPPPPVDDSKPAKWPEGVPKPIETKSAVMVITKFALLHDNKEIAESLDHGEKGFVAVDVTNEGKYLMTDVEVDFYYLDEDGRSHYIDRYVIEKIEPNGDSETAMVSWEASMLAKEIRVIADQDGSDGGPSERVEDITVNPADYFQILKVPYPRGSGVPGDSVNFDIKVMNIGTKTDTVKLRFRGEGNWNAEFEGGTTMKTLSDMEPGEVRYVGFTVDIPNNADYTDMRTITITSRSQNDESKTYSVEIEVFVIHGGDKAILLVNGRAGSGDPPGYWTNTTKMVAAACDDAGYAGMYRISHESNVDYDELMKYDVVIWMTGYRWMGSMSSSTMQDIMDYLDSGGNMWLGGSLLVKANGMGWYGKTRWKMYYDYFNVTYASPQSHPIRPLRGIAGDPIGDNAEYHMNYLYGNHKNDAGQDWCDVVWPKENDKWAHGVFFWGDHFLGVRSEWKKENATTKPYRTFYTGFDIGQIGEYPEKGKYHGDPERADIVYRALSWLGVTPKIPTEDLGVKISDPAGEYIYPGKTTTLNITVSNYGLRDWTSDFTVTVEIEEEKDTEEENDIYSKTLTKTVSGKTIAAGSQAFPDELSVYIDWDVPAGEDRVYWINATIGDDDNNTNNFHSTRVTAKEITDIVFIDGFRETRIQYWECGLAGVPSKIWGIFENQGSTVATFDVSIAIREPVGKEELRNWTFTVENLAPGRRVEVSKVWTPKLGAGTMSHTQSWRRRYSRDPYLIDIGAWEVENDATPGNNGIHSQSPVDDGGGSENSVKGIFFPVAEWAELAETNLHSWDIDNSDAGEDSETTWMAPDFWALDPTHTWWAGVEDSIAEGYVHYDDNAHSRATSQWIDFTRFEDVRYDFIYGYHTQANQDYGAAFYRSWDGESEPSHWQPFYTPYQSGNEWNRSGGSEGQGPNWLNNGQRLHDPDDGASADGNYTQVRWIFHSNPADSETYHGIIFDGFMLMAQAKNYFTNDIGVKGLTVSPLSGDVEVPRDITAVIYNYGDKMAEEYKVNFLITHNETGEVVYNETVEKENLDYESSVEVSITWTPEEEGEYYVNVTTIYEDRWGTDLDEDHSNDFKSVTAKVEYSFLSDDMEGGEKSWWSHGVVDLDGNGAIEALDQWEFGAPDPDFESGPRTVPSGENCWGTVLDGNYGDYGKDGAYLQLEVDLSNARKPVLNLWHWAQIEGQDFDSVFIRAGEVNSRGEVEEWYTLWTNDVKEYEIYETDGWEPLEVALYDEKNDEYDFSFSHIYIQFVLMSDSNINYAGWYIDDITIGGMKPPAKDAAIDAILKPLDGTAIPPGTLVTVEVRVANVGRVAQNIPVNLNIKDEFGYTVLDETKETGTLGAGQSKILTWEWNVGSTAGDIDYILTAEARLSGDEQSFNDMKQIRIQPKVVHDLGILNLYASPWIQDINKPRQITVELKSWSNVDEDSVKVTITAKDSKTGGDNYQKSKEIYTSIFAGDTQKVTWDWKGDKYASYDIEAKVELYDSETDTYYLEDADWQSKGHVNTYTVSGKALTVKKILSVTVDEPPIFEDEVTPDFWDEANSDISEVSTEMGWHILPTGGHNSEKCWYVGKPSTRTYDNKADVSLVSKPMDLSDKPGAILRFYTKFDVEGRLYDNLYFYVKNNSVPWTKTINNKTVEVYPDWQLVKKYPEDKPQSSVDWSGSVNGWILFEYSLEEIYPLEEMTAFQLKFRFKSDADVYKEGVYIDDISIYAMSTENNAPFTRFTATWDSPDGPITAYSMSIIENPPDEYADLGLGPDDNILPRPEEGKQGGVPTDVEIIFDATSTIDPDVEDEFSELTFEWDFGDGTPVFSGKGMSGAQTTHSYSREAFEEYAIVDEATGKKYFPVTLTVTDPSDAETTDSLRVFIGNSPPVVDFNIYSADEELTDDNDPVPGNGYIDVFYGDVIELSEHSFDAEGSINPNSIQWVFEGSGTPIIGKSKIGFTVGGDAYFYAGNKKTAVKGPIFGGEEPSEPTPYTLTLTVKDMGGAQGEKTVTFMVHPYARKKFSFEFYDFENNELSAWAELTWRGFNHEVVTDINSWVPGKVYVGMDIINPDDIVRDYLFAGVDDGWLGLYYSLEVRGAKLQDGEEGFRSITLKIPFTQSTINKYGIYDTLRGDVVAYPFDKERGKFGPDSESYIEALAVADAGDYLEGTVDYSKTLFYTKSISRAGERALVMDLGLGIRTLLSKEKKPDLAVTELYIDRSSLIVGQTVNITATVENTGGLYIPNKAVILRFYGAAGRTLADFELYFGADDPQTQEVTYTYTVTEDETIGAKEGFGSTVDLVLKVKIDADLDIQESDENNNVREETLPVMTAQISVVPSFSAGALMMVATVAVVVLLAAAVTLRKKK